MRWLSRSAVLLAAITFAACTPARADGAAEALGQAFVALRLSRQQAAETPQRHPAIDAAADKLAAQTLAGETSSAGSLAAAAGDMRRGGYPVAGWRAGVWRSSDARDAEVERLEAVLDAWRRRHDDFWNEALGGAWDHFGVGVARGDGVAFALVVAHDGRVGRRRALAPLRDVAAVAAAVLAAANAARASEGLPALEGDPRLDAVARDHAADMLARGYYDHRAPNGSTPMVRVHSAGVQASAVAENIAKGVFAPAEVVDRWLHSPGHRRNLLARGVWRHGAGIAVRESGAEAPEVVWVELFAR